MNPDEWIKVVYGLVISTVLGFGSGYAFTRLIRLACQGMSRARTDRFFRDAQIVAGAGVAILHGAQDGQEVPLAVHARHHAGHPRQRR